MGNASTKKSGGGGSSASTQQQEQKIAYARSFSTDQARTRQMESLTEFHEHHKLPNSIIDKTFSQKRESLQNKTNNTNDAGTATTDPTQKSSPDKPPSISTDTTDQEPPKMDDTAIGHRSLSPGMNLAEDEPAMDALASKEAHLKKSSSMRREKPDIDEKEDATKNANTTNGVALHREAQAPKARGLMWGYAELTRKPLDEDQAAFMTWEHPYDGFIHAWAIFDGHGGYETALYCAQHFLNHVKKYHIHKNKVDDWPQLMRTIFVKFDEFIGTLRIRGGCTVVVILLLGNSNTLISANVGDARAVYSMHNGQAFMLSWDHTPMNDYDRIVAISKQQSKLISKHFRINGKNETYEDMKALSPVEQRKTPIITREHDKSRLLATIGVARGFGDFNLTVFGMRSIPIKPFLSCEPYVSVTELRKGSVRPTDVMVVACDGVFDVLSNQEVINKMREYIWSDNESELKQTGYKLGYHMLDQGCQKLGRLAYSRGTMDDVTCFVVPLYGIFTSQNNVMTVDIDSKE